MDATPYASLDFRVSLGGGTYLNAPMNFSVSLVDSLGQVSRSVKLTDLALIQNNGHPYTKLYQTVRVPLAAFTGVDPALMKTVRLTFDQTASGKIYLANVWLVKAGVSAPIPAPDPAPLAAFERETPAPQEILSVSHTKITARKEPSRFGGLLNVLGLGVDSGGEITVESDVPFLPKDELLTLKVGGQEIRDVRIDDYDTLRKVTFTPSASQWSALTAGSAVHVGYGKHLSRVWDVGQW